ncbi:MAG: hypothetical protein Q9200_007734, partial [Gallowayella weberi]
MFRLLPQRITDLIRFPSFLREKVQACLTLLWIKRFPPFQSSSPATLIANALRSLLGSTIKDYTFIDFCSGAGGPTPYFEREINRALELQSIQQYHDQNADTTTRARRKDVTTKSHSNGTIASSSTSDPTVDFILTDLHPHIPSWRLACSRSPNLHY